MPLHITNKKNKVIKSRLAQELNSYQDLVDIIEDYEKNYLID